MKTILFSMLLLLSSFIFSQEDYARYYSGYMNEYYDIELFEHDDGSYSFLIECISLDDYSKEVGILVAEIDLQKFLVDFRIALAKYEEWTKISKEKNLPAGKKVMEIFPKIGGYFHKNNSWHFNYRIPSFFDYHIIENNGTYQYVLILFSTSFYSDDSLTKCDGFALSFSSTVQINNFLALFDDYNIAKFRSRPTIENTLK